MPDGSTRATHLQLSHARSRFGGSQPVWMRVWFARPVARLLLRSLRAFAECAFGRALEPIVARWWANVTSRETIERNDSPYGDVLPHWDKDESLQRSELKIGRHCAAPTHGISALLRGPDAHVRAALVWLQAARAIRPPAAEYGDVPNGYV